MDSSRIMVMKEGRLVEFDQVRRRVVGGGDRIGGAGGCEEEVGVLGGDCWW